MVDSIGIEQFRYQIYFYPLILFVIGFYISCENYFLAGSSYLVLEDESLANFRHSSVSSWIYQQASSILQNLELSTNSDGVGRLRGGGVAKTEVYQDHTEDTVEHVYEVSQRTRTSFRQQNVGRKNIDAALGETRKNEPEDFAGRSDGTKAWMEDGESNSFPVYRALHLSSEAEVEETPSPKKMTTTLIVDEAQYFTNQTSFLEVGRETMGTQQRCGLADFPELDHCTRKKIVRKQPFPQDWAGTNGKKWILLKLNESVGVDCVEQVAEQVKADVYSFHRICIFVQLVVFILNKRSDQLCSENDFSNMDKTYGVELCCYLFLK